MPCDAEVSRPYARGAGHSRRQGGQARLGRAGSHGEIRGGPSCWGPVRHFDKHPGDLKRCGLGRPHSKPWYHLRISEMGHAILRWIMSRMAGGDAAHGAKTVDSCGFGIARYADRYNAIYGKISANVCAKMRIVQTAHGKICAAMAAPGRADDPPYLRAMIAMMPHGSGYVLADTQYGGLENCQAIKGGRCRPVIESKSGYEIYGFNAGAEMLRFLGKRPGTFHKLPRKKNGVESVFSSMKERFGVVVRAVKTNAQTVELLSTRTCHNTTFA